MMSRAFMRGLRAVHANIQALRRVAAVPPDTPLPDDLQAEVPTLQKLGWLKIIEHSDGDYVVPSEKGHEVLNPRWREAET